MLLGSKCLLYGAHYWLPTMGYWGDNNNHGKHDNGWKQKGKRKGKGSSTTYNSTVSDPTQQAFCMHGLGQQPYGLPTTQMPCARPQAMGQVPFLFTTNRRVDWCTSSSRAKLRNPCPGAAQPPLRHPFRHTTCAWYAHCAAWQRDSSTLGAAFSNWESWGEPITADCQPLVREPVAEQLPPPTRSGDTRPTNPNSMAVGSAQLPRQPATACSWTRAHIWDVQQCSEPPTHPWASGLTATH